MLRQDETRRLDRPQQIVAAVEINDSHRFRLSFSRVAHHPVAIPSIETSTFEAVAVDQGPWNRLLPRRATDDQISCTDDQTA